MDIRFGIPKKEKEINPLDNTPSIRMEKVEGKGENRRFVLNKKAIELLQLVPGVSHIAFAFDGEGSAYVSKNNTEDSFLLGKNMAFSNKKYYDYIVKIYGLDSAMDSDFELIDPVAIGDVIVYRMKYIVPEEILKARFSPIIDKEIAHVIEEEHLNFKEVMDTEDMYMNDLLDDVDEETGEVVDKVKREQFLMNAY